MERSNFCGRTRRELLWQAGAGFTGLGLTAMLEQEGFFTNQSVAADGVTEWKNPLAPKQPHFAPKAKNVILLFMCGGASHLETFDHKPKLREWKGRLATELFSKEELQGFNPEKSLEKCRILPPVFDFQQHCSQLNLHLDTKVFYLCFGANKKK